MAEAADRSAILRAAGVVALALAAIPAAVLSVVAARAGPDWALAGGSEAALVVEVTAAAALVGAGIVVWLRGPDAFAGGLLASAGLLRLVGEWNNPDGAPGAVVFTAGLALAAAAAAPLAHVLLLHGDGRLRGWLAWLATAGAYAGAVVLLGVAPTLVSDPRAQGCPSCPVNLLRITTDFDLKAALGRWGLGVLAGALALAIVIALVRLTFAGGAHRRMVAPVVVPASAVLGLVAVECAHSWERGFLSNDPVDRRLWLLQALAIWLVVVGVIWQRLDARRTRAALTRVVVELGDSPRPGALRDALADAFGDPDLELLHADGDGWIDGNGGARRLPENAETIGRSTTTVLVRDERIVAALVHRQGLFDDPSLVRELDRSARLALEHDRLHAHLRAQLERLRASRAQIVAAADAERRRLERDLHDGAQQTLAALAMALGLAGADATDRRRAERLNQAQDAVRAALADVRALAHAVSPAALTDGGLAAALDVLAEWAPELEITRVPAERFDPAVESAAYFAVASLVRAVSGRIVVDAARNGGTLILEVRTARPPGPLIDVEDRVGALDGRLAVEQLPEDGTVVRVVLPCGS
jgi:signal transduction histidine kinase